MYILRSTHIIPLTTKNATCETNDRRQVDEMAEKLDGVMLVIFTYLDQRLTAKASIPAEAILSTNASEEEAVAVNGHANANGHGAENNYYKAVIGESEEDAAAGGVGTLPATSTARRRRQSVSGVEQGVEPVARLLQVLIRHSLCKEFGACRSITTVVWPVCVHGR